LRTEYAEVSKINFTQEDEPEIVSHDTCRGIRMQLVNTGHVDRLADCCKAEVKNSIKTAMAKAQSLKWLRAERA